MKIFAPFAFDTSDCLLRPMRPKRIIRAPIPYRPLKRLTTIGLVLGFLTADSQKELSVFVAEVEFVIVRAVRTSQSEPMFLKVEKLETELQEFTIVDLQTGMIPIPAGTYKMGTPDEEVNRHSSSKPSDT